MTLIALNYQSNQQTRKLSQEQKQPLYDTYMKSQAVVFMFRKDNRLLEQFIYSTYTIVLPIIVTALMGYVVWLLKNQKKDRDANSKGTMLLLRVQLIEYHDKYMRLGDIPSYAYENFMEMYYAYHALGGNGMITKMMHEIEELHLKKKEV